MSNVAYQQFMKRWEEVTDLPPQSLGPLTNSYKWFTKRFKVMPWPWFIGLSIIVSIIIFLALGSTISYLVTLLQKGF